MGHNSFCGSHSEMGAEQTGNATAAAPVADAHKVTIEVRDERGRNARAVRQISNHAALLTLGLDAFSFVMIALFARHDVISNGVAAFLVGAVIGTRIAECRLRVRARAAAAVGVVLLGLWGVLALCASG